MNCIVLQTRKQEVKMPEKFEQAQNFRKVAIKLPEKYSLSVDSQCFSIKIFILRRNTSESFKANH